MSVGAPNKAVLTDKTVCIEIPDYLPPEEIRSTISDHALDTVVIESGGHRYGCAEYKLKFTQGWPQKGDENVCFKDVCGTVVEAEKNYPMLRLGFWVLIPEVAVLALIAKFAPPATPEVAKVLVPMGVGLFGMAVKGSEVNDNGDTFRQLEDIYHMNR